MMIVFGFTRLAESVRRWFEAPPDSDAAGRVRRMLAHIRDPSRVDHDHLPWIQRG